jgi:hypothetical protein
MFDERNGFQDIANKRLNSPAGNRKSQAKNSQRGFRRRKAITEMVRFARIGSSFSLRFGRLTWRIRRWS